MQYDMRALAPSATLLTHLLRVGTCMFPNIWWLEHEMPGKAMHLAPYTMQENVWQPELCRTWLVSLYI